MTFRNWGFRIFPQVDQFTISFRMDTSFRLGLCIKYKLLGSLVARYAWLYLLRRIFWRIPETSRFERDTTPFSCICPYANQACRGFSTGLEKVLLSAHHPKVNCYIATQPMKERMSFSFDFVEKAIQAFKHACLNYCYVLFSIPM